MTQQAPSPNRWLLVCPLTAAAAVSAHFQLVLWLLLLPALFIATPFLWEDMPGTREWRRATRDIAAFCALLLFAVGSPIGWGWLLLLAIVLSVPDLRAGQSPQD